MVLVEADSFHLCWSLDEINSNGESYGNAANTG